VDVVDLLSVLSIVSLSLDSCSLALLSLALDSFSLRSSFIAFLSNVRSHFCLTKHSHVLRGIIASLAAELDVSDNVSKVVVQAIHSHLIGTALLKAHALFAVRTGSTLPLRPLIKNPSWRNKLIHLWTPASSRFLVLITVAVNHLLGCILSIDGFQVACQDVNMIESGGSSDSRVDPISGHMI
jgi:hypothetical protein